MTLRMKNGSETVYTSDADSIDLPIAVLIDDQSISAAEFFAAAALQDYDRADARRHAHHRQGTRSAHLPAERRLGGQSVYRGILYAQGQSLADVGIAPDIEVKLTDEHDTELFFLTSETDPQLQKRWKLWDNRAPGRKSGQKMVESLDMALVLNL